MSFFYRDRIAVYRLTTGAVNGVGEEDLTRVIVGGLSSVRAKIENYSGDIDGGVTTSERAGFYYKVFLPHSALTAAITERDMIRVVSARSYPYLVGTLVSGQPTILLGVEKPAGFSVFAYTAHVELLVRRGHKF